MAIVTNQSSIHYYSGQLLRRVLEFEESLKRNDLPAIRQNLLDEIKTLEKHIASLKNAAGIKNSIINRSVLSD